MRDQRKIRINVENISYHFLTGKLADQKVIDWAIDLTQEKQEERNVIKDLVRREGDALPVLYKEAWDWILYSWSVVELELHPCFRKYTNKFRNNKIPNNAAHEIARYVKPTLRIDTVPDWVYRLRKKPSKPKHISDILHYRIRCKTYDIQDLDLSLCNDTSFLQELAEELNYNLTSGLSLAKKTGLIKSSSEMRVRRVYYYGVPVESEDPDRYAHGFAPSAKLLYEVFSRLKEIDITQAKSLATYWKMKGDVIYLRLWAAAARIDSVVEINDVGEFLLNLSDEEFWDYIELPEYTELRAVRWIDFQSDQRALLEKRILKGLPLTYWSRRETRQEKESFRNYRIVVELLRICVTGVTLCSDAQSRLDEIQKQMSPMIVVNSVTHDFVEGPRTMSGCSSSDPNQFNDIAKGQLLDKLEHWMATNRWDESASVFVQKNVEMLIGLVGDERTGDKSRANIIIEICRNVTPENVDDRNNIGRLLKLLSTLSTTDSCSIVNEIGNWLVKWSAELKNDPLIYKIWFKYWPHAVEATNDPDSRFIGMDLSHASINSAAGYFTTLFLNLCRTTNLLDNQDLIKMRSLLNDSSGLAHTHILYLFLQQINWFYSVDPRWTKKYLINALADSDGYNKELWVAVSANSLNIELFFVLNEKMMDAILDPNMDGKISTDLAQRLIYDTIDYIDNDKHVVDTLKIQQMLRNGTNEIRASVIDALNKVLSYDKNPGLFFSGTIVPLFHKIWPKDKTLRSVLISKQMVKMPFKSGESFSDAVNLIEAYLIPFEVYGIYCYGFNKKNDISEDFADAITTRQQAKSFLMLLDITIVDRVGFYLPFDLDVALLHIIKIDPSLASDVRYKRLETLARK